MLWAIIEKMDHALNITEEICPMTMVRTRLLLDKMKKGECAEILLKGKEPKQNVPQSIIELGDELVSLEPVEDPKEAELYRLIVRRCRD